MADKLWLTVDPGEETGFAVWEGTELLFSGQEKMWAFIDKVDAWANGEPGALADLVEEPATANRVLGGIVSEDWKIYPQIAESGRLNYDSCRTARAIGALQLIARQHGLSWTLQMATIKEGAEAAGSKELYVTPQHENRHANDAIDHGVFYTAKNGKGPC